MPPQTDPCLSGVVRDTPRLDCQATLPRSEYRKRPAVRVDAMTDLMEAQLAKLRLGKAMNL